MSDAAAAITSPTYLALQRGNRKQLRSRFDSAILQHRQCRSPRVFLHHKVSHDVL